MSLAYFPDFGNLEDPTPNSSHQEFLNCKPINTQI